MQDRPLERIRLLATDYDGTAITLYGTRSDMLSTSLIQHAFNNYAAFYGITHRSYAAANLVKKTAVIKAMHSNYSVEEIENNITTTKVTEHFAAATKLPCLGVSMLDDAVNQFGYTYESMIKPYELTGKLADAESQYIPIYKIPTYLSNKNNQLIQIAHHATQRYPNCSITLDFIDDHEYLCYEAVKVVQDKAWPKDIDLNISHHYASSDGAMIEPIYQQRVGYLATKKSYSTLQRVGLFATATVFTGVVMNSAYLSSTLSK